MRSGPYYGSPMAVFRHPVSAYRAIDTSCYGDSRRRLSFRNPGTFRPRQSGDQPLSPSRSGFGGRLRLAKNGSQSVFDNRGGTRRSGRSQRRGAKPAPVPGPQNSSGERVTAALGSKLSRATRFNCFEIAPVIVLPETHSSSNTGGPFSCAGPSFSHERCHGRHGRI